VEIKLALGTDDGIKFSDGHFGSSKYFLVYGLDLETNRLRFIEKLDNSSPEERSHGDPRKAKNISQLLRGVSVLVGFRMGPNIVRIRKGFVPVISRQKDIETALEKIKGLGRRIEAELEKAPGTDKKILHLD